MESAKTQDCLLKFPVLFYPERVFAIVNYLNRILQFLIVLLVETISSFALLVAYSYDQLIIEFTCDIFRVLAHD